jgi:hypothetical protein
MADDEYKVLEHAKAAIFVQVRKAIGYLEIDPHHPSLNTHKFTSLNALALRGLPQPSFHAGQGLRVLVRHSLPRKCPERVEGPAG